MILCELLWETSMLYLLDWENKIAQLCEVVCCGLRSNKWNPWILCSMFLE